MRIVDKLKKSNINTQVTILESYSFTVFFLLFVCKKCYRTKHNLYDVENNEWNDKKTSDRSEANFMY